MNVSILPVQHMCEGFDLDFSVCGTLFECFFIPK